MGGAKRNPSKQHMILFLAFPAVWRENQLLRSYRKLNQNPASSNKAGEKQFEFG
jgi:hypothetical protein